MPFIGYSYKVNMFYDVTTQWSGFDDSFRERLWLKCSASVSLGVKVSWLRWLRSEDDSTTLTNNNAKQYWLKMENEERFQENIYLVVSIYLRWGETEVCTVQ